MILEINFEGLNIPPSIQKSFLKMAQDYSDNVTSKASIFHELGKVFSSAIKEVTGMYWEENEAIFLQHGTSKKDVEILIRRYFSKLISYYVENIDELAFDDEE